MDSNKFIEGFEICLKFSRLDFTLFACHFGQKIENMGEVVRYDFCAWDWKNNKPRRKELMKIKLKRFVDNIKLSNTLIQSKIY